MRTQLAVVAIALGLTGCVGDGKFLQDDAACPAADGADCTADVRDRVDALESLSGVTEVVLVERSENLDTAPTRHAEILADVADEHDALELAARALATLDDWPEHEDGGLSLLLTADPPVMVDYVGHQRTELPASGLDPCADPDCGEVFEQVKAGVEAEYDGVGTLSFRRTGDSLVVRGRVDGAQAELVSRAVEGHIIESGFRVARQVDVVIRGRAPLSLEYHVEGDVVCGTPPNTHAGCEGRASVPFPG